MNLIKKNIDAIIFFSLMAFLVGDFLSNLKYENFRFSNTPFFYRYAGLIKLLFEVFMISLISINMKNYSRTFWVLIIVSLTFFISQLYLSSVIDYDIKRHFLSGNIYFYNCYIYLLIFVIFIENVDVKKETFQKAYKYFEYFLYINAIAIALGFLFKIEIFRSYEYTPRFGFSGLFSKPGEASYMYAIAIIVSYYHWISHRSKFLFFKLLLFITCSLCLGQKKVYLFLLLLGVVFLIHNNRYKKFFRLFLPFTVLIFILFKENIVTAILKFSPFWESIYHQSGLISTITSYRNELLELAALHIDKNWTFINYIVGGLDFNTFKVEFEFIDLYLFLGISGVLYYLHITSMLLNKNDFLMRNLIVIVFVTSFFSRGLLLNVTSVIFLYIAVKFIMPPVINSSVHN
ncbi:hypothetical protein N7U66_12955 [Lacinutrix neustonica]|uniref:Uncharacterized protein n=1 Tax=Lacinutrix neustonica TaxID=2980107 RepID=A0A9E8MTB3_9FLAO|nr:hypothetical protein [Lacinutrix neustonica]WAC01078.1 hypothetical protein N7U66_12955 [Lacinutrix neustonica]